jgi:hypothetical protein
MRYATFALIASMLAHSGYAAERVFDHWITETTLFRGIALSPREFSETRVKALASRMLSAASTRKLISIVYVPDTPESFRGASFATEVDSFKWWRHQYEWIVDYSMPVAKMTLIDGDGVLEFRDSHGRESRTVLCGSDPLRFRRGGVNYEIVGIHREGGEVMPVIELLIRTDRVVEEDGAKTLAQEYRTRLGVRNVWFWFRTDCWFANQYFYPTFKGCGSPPSEEEYRRAAAVGCYVTGAGIRCTGGL